MSTPTRTPKCLVIQLEAVRLHPTVFPVRLKQHLIHQPAFIFTDSYATRFTTCTTSNGPIHFGRSFQLAFWHASGPRNFTLKSTLTPVDKTFQNTFLVHDVTIGVLTTGPRLQSASNDTFLQPNYYTYSNSDLGST
jgi:hypothetical protein